MRAIWKGSISFGLVNIPVSLFPAMRREELKFRLLRASDQSPVNYKRVAEADGREVPWDQIVKGYEYEKGKFVVLKDEDFKRIDIEAAQTVDIINFVSLDEVSPLLFYKPYYMEVSKGGDKAYVLLRDALISSGKIGIAKVVIKTRQHLAAVKAQESGLMLELMHFPDELVDTGEFKAPKTRKAGDRELKMARDLISGMTTRWQPEKYRDDFREALEELVEEKIKNRGREPAAPRKRKAASNVIDLAAVLQESLRATKSKSSSSSSTTKRSSPRKSAKTKSKSTKSRRKAA
jgi:Ku protein, prokaryotic